MTGTEKPAQPVVATEIRGTDLGPELGSTAQVCAQAFSDKDFRPYGPGGALDIFGLDGNGRIRILQLRSQLVQVGELGLGPVDDIDRLAAPLDAAVRKRLLPVFTPSLLMLFLLITGRSHRAHRP